MVGKDYMFEGGVTFEVGAVIYSAINSLVIKTYPM